MSDTLLDRPAHLFEIAPARQYRPSSTYGSRGSEPFVASNPPRGAVIHYYLRDSADKDVRLVITGAEDDTVRTLTGRGYPGLHRLTWDLLRDEPRPRRLGEPTSSTELRRVDPGEYTVTLRVHGLTLERSLLIEEGWPGTRLGELRD